MSQNISESDTFDRWRSAVSFSFSSRAWAWASASAAAQSHVHRVIDRAKSRVMSTLKVRSDPREEFHTLHYLRHNQRRLEHLASLGLPLADRSVLEVGAGIGDHTSFFLDRGCRVLCTEGRRENLEVLRARFAGDPRVTVQALDLEQAARGQGLGAAPLPVDIVYCYGLLYHLSDPTFALSFLGACARHLLLLETSVSFGEGEAINLVAEDATQASQALSGQGCRPTRRWVFNRLRASFPHVYLPRTQPCHEEFPLDWSGPAAGPAAPSLSRAVFIASRAPLESPLLCAALPERQQRQA